MSTSICRLCGSLATNNLNIFCTHGLKQKIETCLPITLHQPSLLPDTICTKCVESLDLFYTFTKHCLQNILILESQYNITESCLRSKRKHDRGCSTISDNYIEELSIDVNITKYKERCETFQRLLDGSEKLLTQSSHFGQVQLVDYEDSQDEDDYKLGLRRELVCSDDEIARGAKRQMTDILPHRTKIFKFCTNRRRKNTQPQRLMERTLVDNLALTRVDNSNVILPVNLLGLRRHSGSINIQRADNPPHSSVIVDADCDMPQEVIEAEVVCLLCDALFTGSDMLAMHVLQTHGIDMARIISSEPVPETQQYKQHEVTLEVKMEPEQEDIKPMLVTTCIQEDHAIVIKSKRCNRTVNRKQLPKPTSININSSEQQESDHLPYQELAITKPVSPFACPFCPATLPNRTDLFTHLRLKHPERVALLCGLCFSPNINTFYDLHTHLDKCKAEHEIAERYYCKVCYYSDNSTKTMEIHIAVHDFLVAYCKEEKKLFDPEEYIEHNLHTSNTDERFQCDDCPDIEVFLNLCDYVAHQRLAHEIFVCDLCTKSYGRSSHLWKHVHRLHKGHPTVTCPICEKTSASKYHLTQHFIKAHTTKTVNSIANDEKDDDFLTKKFAAFDFQSVRQSFMKQELVETNIKFVCPVCSKFFVKRSLLKKHRTNCRPRPQKDLLTRCKSCSRIFKDRLSLTKHLLNHHSEYTCEICKTIVISKCEIVSHIRFLHPNCRLFCQQCGEILRTQAELHDHLADHENSNVCQFCGDLLNSKIKLKMHILSLHRKILSLSCGICFKLFQNQHVLRDHVQMNHKNDLNPLTSCPICGKNYGSKWKAYDHLNKSHGKMFHACRNCLAVFDEQFELKRHCEQLGVCGNLVVVEKPAKIKTEDMMLLNRGIENGNNNEFDVEDGDVDSGGNDDQCVQEDNNKSRSCSEASDVEVKREPVSEDWENSEETDLREVVNAKGMDVKDKDDGLKKKMSLLEKRLLGKRVSEDVEEKVVQGNPAEKGRQTFTPPSVDHPSPHSPSTACHLIAATTKRTVYVNALAPARCGICGKTWPAKKHLWQHYIRCHRPEAATVCGICLCANGGSYATLARHLDTEHAELLYGKGYGSNFICRVCGRYHNARSKLRMHMAIHTGYIADKGKSPSAVRSTTLRSKPRKHEEQDIERDINEDKCLPYSSEILNKVEQDLQNGPPRIKKTYSDQNLLNLNCKTECIEGSSSNNSSDDDNDSDNDIVISKDANPLDTTPPFLSTSPDTTTTDSATTNRPGQPHGTDTSSTISSSDENAASNNNVTAAAQLQLVNAVESINTVDLLTTLPNDNAVDDYGDDNGTMLPSLDGAVDTVGQLLSHELQSAVDSIL